MSNDKQTEADGGLSGLTGELGADSRTKEQLLQVRDELLADNRALRLEVEELRDGRRPVTTKRRSTSSDF